MYFLGMDNIKTFISNALREDIGPGDLTTEALIQPDIEGKAELIAKEISDHFVSHEGWDGNDETLRSLKTALYKTLMKTALKDNMVEVAERILKLQAEVGKHVKN